MGRKAHKRIKHVPQRTCIGCRNVLSKRELIRIVRTPEGVVIDPTGKIEGRGAYLHNQKSCWEQAVKGAINNALRVELNPADKARLEEFIKTLPADEPPLEDQTRDPGQKGSTK